MVLNCFVLYISVFWGNGIWGNVIIGTLHFTTAAYVLVSPPSSWRRLVDPLECVLVVSSVMYSLTLKDDLAALSVEYLLYMLYIY